MGVGAGVHLFCRFWFCLLGDLIFSAAATTMVNRDVLTKTGQREDLFGKQTETLCFTWNWSCSTRCFDFAPKVGVGIEYVLCCLFF